MSQAAPIKPSRTRFTARANNEAEGSHKVHSAIQKKSSRKRTGPPPFIASVKKIQRNVLNKNKLSGRFRFTSKCNNLLNSIGELVVKQLASECDQMLTRTQTNKNRRGKITVKPHMLESALRLVLQNPQLSQKIISETHPTLEILDQINKLNKKNPSSSSSKKEKQQPQQQQI